MKKRFGKLSCVLLAAALAFSMTGCGGSDKKKSSEKTDGSVQEEAKYLSRSILEQRLSIFLWMTTRVIHLYF